jgi:hypothetical protein
MYFDFAMPLTLFMVTLLAVFLNKRVENKLKNVLEGRKLGFWSAVLFIAAIGVMVSLIVFIPQMTLVTLFLSAYSMLLFMFTYLFSNFKKHKAQIFCIAFLIITFSAGVSSLFILSGNRALYGTLTFFGLFSFAFLALLYEETRVGIGERWYLAVLPPALFISLYLFFSKTPIWFPYLLNFFGIVFAVLISLYIGNLFTWKATLIFAGLLTIIDIILVLFTDTMVSAVEHTSSLRLPVVVLLPTFPFGKGYMLLGLGDFFFAGLLAIQTLKKYGKNFAVLAVAAMALSFFIFESVLLNVGPVAFPGTLMIICGWMLLILLKILWILWKHLKIGENVKE